LKARSLEGFLWEVMLNLSGLVRRRFLRVPGRNGRWKKVTCTVLGAGESMTYSGIFRLKFWVIN
jgi:hypothetical protein